MAWLGPGGMAKMVRVTVTTVREVNLKLGPESMLRKKRRNSKLFSSSASSLCKNTGRENEL